MIKSNYFGGGHLRYVGGEWLDDNGDSVDAVEVVRCKNCKWQDPSDMSSGYTWCDMLCRQMRETDFCSNGKEKDT